MAFAQGYGESPYIFGFHDPGGEYLMADKGKKGWIVFTRAVGRNPGDMSGSDFRSWADAGYGVIVRINHGYGTAGTLPYSKYYDDFAQRVKNFVQNSPGAHIWIVGNEINYQGEWPRDEEYEEPITVDLYVQCFTKCRNLIKGLPGHAGDQVITQGLSPTGAVAVGYHRAMLDALGEGGLDGIALHTYSCGSSASSIFSSCFRAYRDFMNAHPAWARSLPVYITETDQGANAWVDANSGWVKNAYAEINAWNTEAGNQQIRALALYRWSGDQWYIEGKQGVIQDFQEAMNNDYRWNSGATPYCGDSSCNGQETCSTCPQDCLLSGQVCCSGIAYTGTCCSNSDCASPQACSNHVCTSPQYFLPDQIVEAESGTLSSPMQADSGNQYIYTSTSDQGSASFIFNITSAGKYRMEARVLTPGSDTAATNSFYLGLDNEPAQGNNNYTYDTLETASFDWDNVSLRSPQGDYLQSKYDPMIWDLSQGLHNFTFYGRESNTWLDQIILKRACHKSDSDCDSCISDLELTAFISRWYVSNQDVTISELIQAIGFWKNGGC